jgi:hypothetical protein
MFFEGTRHALQAGAQWLEPLAQAHPESAMVE